MHPFLTYFQFIQAQLPPIQDENIILALLDHANRCKAKLGYYGTSLQSEQKNSIIGHLNPIAAAHNLSVALNQNPIFNRVHCDLALEERSRLEVTYCNRVAGSSFSGLLRFEYVDALFNTTQINEVLEQSTAHECGPSPYVYIGYVLAGLFTLGLLGLLGMNCHKRVFANPEIHPKPESEAPSEQTASTSSHFTNKGFHLFETDKDNSDQGEHVRRPMLG